MSDITLKEAVEYLSKKEKTYQHCGASYIQHNTFINENAKEEVCLVICHFHVVSHTLSIKSAVSVCLLLDIFR